MAEILVLSADFVGIVSHEEDQTASLSFLAKDAKNQTKNLHLILTRASLHEMSRRIQNELSQLPEPPQHH